METSRIEHVAERVEKKGDRAHHHSDLLPAGTVPLMADSWHGLQYVRDGMVKLGAVTRQAGAGDWQAFRYGADGPLPLGDYPTVEDAQRAVEKACE